MRSKFVLLEGCVTHNSLFLFLFFFSDIMYYLPGAKSSTDTQESIFIVISEKIPESFTGKLMFTATLLTMFTRKYYRKLIGTKVTLLP